MAWDIASGFFCSSADEPLDPGSTGMALTGISISTAGKEIGFVGSMAFLP
jgi:hypothetical protein